MMNGSPSSEGGSERREWGPWTDGICGEATGRSDLGAWTAGHLSGLGEPSLGPDSSMYGQAGSSNHHPSEKRWLTGQGSVGGGEAALLRAWA